MADSLRIGFVPIARPTFDTELAATLTGQARRHLARKGWDLYGPEEMVMDMAAAQTAADDLSDQALDLLLLFQATFADSSMTMALAERLNAPLLLWALPETPDGGRLRLNSLCGINLSAFSLKKSGRPFHYVYAGPEDRAVLAQVETLARAGRALRTLRQTQIGVIGQHPDGFDPCHYHAGRLSALLGVGVVPFELPFFFDKVRAQPPERVEAELARLGEILPNLPELDQKAVRGTLGSLEALRDLAQAEALGGIAVRCWPEFFTELGCAACGALSLMSDAGVPCSCEADVNGTITQLILQSVGDGPAFGTDLVIADEEDDTVVFWHCGLAPLSMADPSVQPRGTVHSNRKLPLLMEFPLKPGRVTIARLSESGDAGYRLVVGRGEMLARPNSFSGTSGVCRLDRPVGDVLDVIMGEGLEHHYSITYGDYLAPLLVLAEMLQLPVVQLTE
ncbi:MAG: L-fucose/L-arabinose isomerase family protein [Anaerolineae bacterium]